MSRFHLPPHVKLGAGVPFRRCALQRSLRGFVHRRALHIPLSDVLTLRRPQVVGHAKLRDVFRVGAREPRLPPALWRLRQRHDVGHVAPSVENIRHVVHRRRAQLRGSTDPPAPAMRLRRLHHRGPQRGELHVDDRRLRARLDLRWIPPVRQHRVHHAGKPVVVGLGPLCAGEVHRAETHSLHVSRGSIHDS